MIAYIFFLLITLILPIAVAIIISWRLRTAKPVLLGAACFFLVQVCLRIPLIQYVLPLSAQYTVWQITYPTLYLILLALSAGVFEECGRYLFLKLGKQNTLPDGIAFGIGHGGIESILLVGINGVALLFHPAMLYAVAPVGFILSALERLFTMATHVGLSVIVLSSLRKGKGWLLLLAIALHGLLDFGAVSLSQRGVDAWIIETGAAIFAALVVWLAIIIWKQNTKEEYK